MLFFSFICLQHSSKQANLHWDKCVFLHYYVLLKVRCQMSDTLSHGILDFFVSLNQNLFG